MSLSMRPLSQNNSQISNVQRPAKKAKITAADSTGVENQIIEKHHHSVKKAQTPSVKKRNQRERNRVQGVNDGFKKLKQFVPGVKDKSSKVEALRGAIEYIKQMKKMLGEDVSDILTPPSPVTTSQKYDFADEDGEFNITSDSSPSIYIIIIADTSSNVSDTDNSLYSTPSVTPASVKQESPELINPVLLSLPTSSFQDFTIPSSSFSMPVSPPALAAVSLPACFASAQPLPLPSIHGQVWWPQEHKPQL